MCIKILWPRAHACARTRITIERKERDEQKKEHKRKMCTCNIVLNENCTLTQNRATTKPNNIALITKEHTHTCNRGHHIAIVHFNSKVYWKAKWSDKNRTAACAIANTHLHIEQHDIFTPAWNRFLSFCCLPPLCRPLFHSSHRQNAYAVQYNYNL